MSETFTSILSGFQIFDSFRAKIFLNLGFLLQKYSLKEKRFQINCCLLSSGLVHALAARGDCLHGSNCSRNFNLYQNRRLSIALKDLMWSSITPQIKLVCERQSHMGSLMEVTWDLKPKLPHGPITIQYMRVVGQYFLKSVVEKD